MEHFPFQAFLSIVNISARFSAMPLRVMGEEERRSVAKLLMKYYEAFAMDGLAASSATLNRICDLVIGEEPVESGTFSALLAELEGRMRDELMAVTLFSLNPQDAKLYKSPRIGWETAIEQFPSAIAEIEEGAKC